MNRDKYGRVDELERENLFMLMFSNLLRHLGIFLISAIFDDNCVFMEAIILAISLQIWLKHTML